jgi:hypothetical protein
MLDGETPQQEGQERHTRRLVSAHIRFASLWYHKINNQSFSFNQKLSFKDHTSELVAKVDAVHMPFVVYLDGKYTI